MSTGVVGRAEELRDLFAYHRWANARILDAAAKLSAEQYERDLGNSFGSIRATLGHVLGADWVWLRRWSGESPRGFPEWDVSTPALLREHWRRVEAEQLAFLDAERDFDRAVDYTLMSGAASRQTLAELCRHVVNHATYHRGQVVTMLRQLGAQPPPTDLIVYYRERG